MAELQLVAELLMVEIQLVVEDMVVKLLMVEIQMVASAAGSPLLPDAAPPELACLSCRLWEPSNLLPLGSSVGKEWKGGKNWNGSFRADAF